MASYKFLLPALAFFVVSLTQSVSAQISAYDSMYFPTTQSLEGTRSAPQFYEVLGFDIVGERAFKAQVFSDLKQGYSRPDIARSFQNTTALISNGVLPKSSFGQTLHAQTKAPLYSDLQIESLSQRVHERLQLMSLVSLRATVHNDTSSEFSNLDFIGNSLSISDFDDSMQYSYLNKQANLPFSQFDF